MSHGISFFNVNEPSPRTTTIPGLVMPTTDNKVEFKGGVNSPRTIINFFQVINNPPPIRQLETQEVSCWKRLCCWRC
jgi:hypothetical protein